MFPVELIPFKSNSEKKVDIFKKKIIKLQVEQLNLQRDLKRSPEKYEQIGVKMAELKQKEEVSRDKLR